MREKGAIEKLSSGKYKVNFEKFMSVAAELARELLTIEAEGNYERAGTLLDKYGKMNAEIEAAVDRLKDVPRDIRTTYEY